MDERPGDIARAPFRSMGCLRGGFRHPVARVSAATAHLGTLLQELIIAHEFFALLRALPACVGANPAHATVKGRVAQHVIDIRLTQLRAIDEESDELGRGMTPSQAQTMHDRLRADRMAVLAVPNALRHFVSAGVLVFRRLLSGSGQRRRAREEHHRGAGREK